MILHTAFRWWQKDTIVTQGWCIPNEPLGKNKNLVKLKLGWGGGGRNLAN